MKSVLERVQDRLPGRKVEGVWSTQPLDWIRRRNLVIDGVATKYYMGLETEQELAAIYGEHVLDEIADAIVAKI